MEPERHDEFWDEDSIVVDPTAVPEPTPSPVPLASAEELTCILEGGMWDLYEQICDLEWHENGAGEKVPDTVTDPLAGLDDPLGDLDSLLNDMFRESCLSVDVDGVWIDQTGSESAKCLMFDEGADVLCPDTGCFDTLSALCGSQTVCDLYRPEPSPLLDLVYGYDISFDFGITISESEQQRRAAMVAHEDARATEQSSAGPIIATVSCLMAAVAAGVLVHRLCIKGASDADEDFKQAK